MKLLPVFLLVAACTLPLGAEEAIQNGDFVDGTAHWHGDGRSSADFASDNPLQASDPFTAKGMIIPLKQTSWTKAEQVIRPKGGGGVLTITYKLSKDLAFSAKPEDYKNISASMGWGWQPFGGPPGAWLIDITDSTGTKGHYDLITPKAGSTDTQIAKMQVEGMAPHEETTVTLGFPPGTGMVVILGVSLDAQ